MNTLRIIFLYSFIE
uniref:Uncharacterized protein n=1 Tax=Lepeophtheirus salmonis TaxID=72036 RepID=A0A0K2VJH9_LEPSM